MSKPKKRNIYRETGELAEKFLAGRKVMSREKDLETVRIALRPGPSRALLPATVYRTLVKTGHAHEANLWLSLCVDEVAQ